MVDGAIEIVIRENDRSAARLKTKPTVGIAEHKEDADERHVQDPVVGKYELIFEEATGYRYRA